MVNIEEISEIHYCILMNELATITSCEPVTSLSPVCHQLCIQIYMVKKTRDNWVRCHQFVTRQSSVLASGHTESKLNKFIQQFGVFDALYNKSIYQFVEWWIFQKDGLPSYCLQALGGARPRHFYMPIPDRQPGESHRKFKNSVFT